jgi:penicillin-binding protein 2
MAVHRDLEPRAEVSRSIQTHSRLGRLDPVSVVEAGYFHSPAFYLRLSVLAVFVVAVFGIIGLRLWSLQVVHGPSYERVAEKQTVRTFELSTPRGPILDARGRLLAGARGQLVVTADADGLGAVDENGVWRPSASGTAELRRLARLAGTLPRRLVHEIRRRVELSPYTPAAVLTRIARSLAFYLDEHQIDFPHLQVTAVPERSYPLGSFGSEFLGLLGQISAPQLQEPRYRGYSPGEVIGQSGVEHAYDRVLDAGLRPGRVEVNALGRPVTAPRLLTAARKPHGIRLTVDARIQRAAEQAVRHGIELAHRAGHPDANAGAAVVMDPRSGAIYALASYPRFNQAAAVRHPRYLSRLLNPRAGRRPLVNRATQGLYALGSTFKPLVAEAALSTGIITPSSVLPCTGSLTVGNVVFHNVEAGVNASLNLREALKTSCDTWFYRLGVEFYRRQEQGHLDLQRWARRLGLGRETGLDIGGEAAGVIPTPAWLRHTFSAPWARTWYEGTSVNLSIGQGYLEATPLQLAVAYSTLANGGKVVRPHLGAAVVNSSGHVLRRIHVPARRRVRLVDASVIRDALFAAAHEPGGTSAAVFANFPVPIAGKTGTAQVRSGSDNSWYASWAPVRHPQAVVVVLIEHGGFGAEAAAPAARDIYSALFERGRARSLFRAARNSAP